MTHCVFWGSTPKPADVNYVVFLVCILFSILMGMVILYNERKYFHFSVLNKIKITLLNVLFLLIWGYIFYIGVREISIYLGISQQECLFY